MTIPPLPQDISDRLPEARKLLLRPEVRAFAGLSPIKIKPKTSKERVSVTSTPVESMPSGTYGFFLPLYSSEIPAKNRKLFTKLQAQPIQLSSSLTKSGNYQSNLLCVSTSDSSEYEPSKNNLTCRAPQECFVFADPGDFTTALGSLVNDYIQTSEEALSQGLKEIFPDTSYRPLAEDDYVIFFPQDEHDIKKVLGLCMVNRIYQAKFKGRNTTGKKQSTSILEINVDDKVIEFTVKEDAFISSYRHADFTKAQELICTSESKLMEQLSSILRNSSCVKSTENVMIPEVSPQSIVANMSHEDLTRIQSLPTSEDLLEDVDPGSLVTEDPFVEVVPNCELDCSDVIPPHDFIDTEEESSDFFPEEDPSEPLPPDPSEWEEPTPDLMDEDITFSQGLKAIITNLINTTHQQSLNLDKAQSLIETQTATTHKLLEENARLQTENAILLLKLKIFAARDTSVSVSLLES